MDVDGWLWLGGLLGGYHIIGALWAPHILIWGPRFKGVTLQKGDYRERIAAFLLGVGFIAVMVFMKYTHGLISR